MNSNKLYSQRQIRFGEVIREIVSEALTKDFVVNGENDLSVITVSFVKMSKDLRTASIYIMPLGGENKNKILDLLNENKFFFQKAISTAKLKSKFTPKINFFLDDSFEEAERIEKLLLNKKVLRDLNNI
jgi:ribosome-binding factor A